MGTLRRAPGHPATDGRHGILVIMYKSHSMHNCILCPYQHVNLINSFLHLQEEREDTLMKEKRQQGKEVSYLGV